MMSAQGRGFSVGVGGIPGVGKTHLIQTFAGSGANGDAAIAGSSVIKSVIAPSTLGEFKDWTECRQLTARIAAISALTQLRHQTPGALLVDVHFTLRAPGAALPQRVFNAADRTFYDALVLIEVPVSTVVAWRDSDVRRRDVEPPEQVEEHMRAERAEFFRQAAMMGVPHAIIDETALASRLSALRAFLARVRGAV